MVWRWRPVGVALGSAVPLAGRQRAAMGSGGAAFPKRRRDGPPSGKNALTRFKRKPGRALRPRRTAYLIAPAVMPLAILRWKAI